MTEFAAINFVDRDSGDDGYAGVRAADRTVGITVSLASTGDVEAFLGPDDAKTLSSALLTAARFIEVADMPVDPLRVEQVEAGVRCCEPLREHLIEQRHLLRYDPAHRAVILEAPTDGTSARILAYCPFCGARLARTLRDVYYEVLEERGLFPHEISISTEDHLLATDGGPEYLDDTWWRALEAADPDVFDISLPEPGDILRIPTADDHEVLVLGVYLGDPYREERILVVPAVRADARWSATAFPVVAWAYSRGRWPTVGADLEAAGALLARAPNWQHSYFNPIADEMQTFPHEPVGWTYAPAGVPSRGLELEPIEFDTLSAGELGERIAILRDSDR